MAARSTRGASLVLRDLLPNTFEQVEAYVQGVASGVHTSIHELDRLLGGLHPGDLAVLAGRAGCGVTSLALHMAIRAVTSTTAGLYVSLDSPAWQMTERLVCAAANVDTRCLRRGELTVDDIPRIGMTVGDLSDKLLLINDSCRTVADIRDAVEAICEGPALTFVIVDSVGLLEAGIEGVAREKSTSECGRLLKLLAMDHRIAVIALATVAGRFDEPGCVRPTLGDLSSESKIAEYADVVLLTHREALQEPAQESCAGPFHIEIALNRRGPKGGVTVAFNPARGTFDPLTGSEEAF